jgi:hypothetical protein
VVAQVAANTFANLVKWARRGLLGYPPPYARATRSAAWR